MYSPRVTAPLSLHPVFAPCLCTLSLHPVSAPLLTLISHQLLSNSDENSAKNIADEPVRRADNVFKLASTQPLTAICCATLLFLKAQFLYLTRNSLSITLREFKPSLNLSISKTTRWQSLEEIMFLHQRKKRGSLPTL